MYLRDKKRFRELLYHIKKTYHEQRLNKLANLETYDSKSFWSSIRKKYLSYGKMSRSV